MSIESNASNYKKMFPICAKIAVSKEFKLIDAMYGNRVAKRSKVPLINHIIDGLYILYLINASEDAMKAFCLHPIIQSDEDLRDNFKKIHDIDPIIVLLATEYRSIANEYLSNKSIISINDIRLSPLKDVNDMLIADKIQNYKDFLIYHSKTHPRAKELNEYFNNWITRLNCWDVFDVYES